jgi:YtcA family
MRRAAKSVAVGALLLLDVLSFAGCRLPPSINVLGSFFPAWLLCLIMGILLSAGSRILLLAVHLEEVLSPPIVMYPSLTVLFTISLWLLFFY